MVGRKVFSMMVCCPAMVIEVFLWRVMLRKAGVQEERDTQTQTSWSLELRSCPG
jgi:hypothetical protein